MQTILDSNIILDLLHRQDPFFAWSRRWFGTCARQGELVLNTIVFAEISSGFLNFQDAVSVFDRLGTRREDIPPEAAYSAGRAHRLYRERGGLRDRVLADFLIGGHAWVKNYRILTRDASRYRSYFPTLNIIAPDTHP